MSLVKLDVYHVRNIQQLSLHPCPNINFIVGDNASGKSSLLEAIFILGRAKSFRSASIKSVINIHHTHLTVSAQMSQIGTGINQLGIQLDGKSISIRINQESKQQRSDLAYALPLQLIHPKSYELLDAGASLRREFMDWGVFNSDKNFLLAWRRFKKALAQRNALLKSRQLEQLAVWNQEFAYYGTIVHEYRVHYLKKLQLVFITMAQHFLAIENINMQLLAGWDISQNLSAVLDNDFDKDIRYGFTHNGPHRGDFQIFVNHRLAKDFVSRGQLKLLVLCLKLAQVQLLADQQIHLSCILIDDFSAELDMTNRRKLLDFLSHLNSQVFITANCVTDFGDLNILPSYKLFHMEQGTIKPM